MDIAKIRKKIKEEKEGKAGTVPAEEEKEKAPEETAAESPGKQDESPQALPPHEESEESEKAEEEKESLAAAQATGASGRESVKKAAAGEAVYAESGDIIELLTFILSDEEFTFRVSDIEEILRFQRITTVPKMPGYVLGITSLRGKIIPVIDLKKRLLIKGADETDENRKKILILKGSKGPIGAVIDRVKGVIRISRSEIAEPPMHLSEAELVFMEGVVLYNSRFISLIRAREVSEINLK